MEDFNSFAKDSNTNTNPDDISQMVSSIANKFEGKTTNDLLAEIYKQAERGKRNGTLTNAQLENFAKTLAPALDDKKRKYLYKIVEQLKKI